MDGVDRDAITELINLTLKQHIDDKGALCTSFVVITEWIDSNGEYYTLTVKDDDSPPWRHEGLVHYALANEIYDSEESEEGEE